MADDGYSRTYYFKPNWRFSQMLLILGTSMSMASKQGWLIFQKIKSLSPITFTILLNYKEIQNV
jgi:hypothetical protein